MWSFVNLKIAKNVYPRKIYPTIQRNDEDLKVYCENNEPLFNNREHKKVIRTM